MPAGANSGNIIVSASNGTATKPGFSFIANITLCPPVASTSLNSLENGTNFSWKLDTGNGFITIVDNRHHSGVNTYSLHLNNIPSSWNGYIYRCIVDYFTTFFNSLNFEESLLSSANDLRGDAANWSCTSDPDANTNAVIKSGNVIVN